MMFKIFYRLKKNGKLYWERYQARDADTAAKNFAAICRELGERTPIIVRVEAI